MESDIMTKSNYYYIIWKSTLTVLGYKEGYLESNFFFSQELQLFYVNHIFWLLEFIDSLIL